MTEGQWRTLMCTIHAAGCWAYPPHWTGTHPYPSSETSTTRDATSNAFGFTNGASTTNEYTYDANGNLTKDLNKNISNIQYNSLNLPSVVTFGNGNTITYLYTADGKKLRTVHVTNGTATTTDYCGNVIYENSTQKLLLTEEGYVDLMDNSHHFLNHPFHALHDSAR